MEILTIYQGLHGGLQRPFQRWLGIPAGGHLDVFFRTLPGDGLVVDRVAGRIADLDLQTHTCLRHTRPEARAELVGEIEDAAGKLDIAVADPVTTRRQFGFERVPDEDTMSWFAEIAASSAF